MVIVGFSVLVGIISALNSRKGFLFFIRLEEVVPLPQNRTVRKTTDDRTDGRTGGRVDEKTETLRCSRNLLMDILMPELNETEEFKAIKKDKGDLEAKIKDLEDKIFEDETLYYESSYVYSNGSNCMKGWDGFLDAKLEGNDRARQTKVPDEDRYFSKSSKKNTPFNPASVLSDSNGPSRSITPEAPE